MSHATLLEYIRAAKQAGASDGDITARLSSVGWYHVDIQDALHFYGKMTSAAPRIQLSSAPVQARQIAPHTYDPRIVAVACVSFIVGLIGYLVLFR